MNKKLIAKIGVAVGSIILMASSPAMAAYYAYPYLTNLDSGVDGTITLSNIQWSGSYNPQLATTIVAGGYSSGTLKTVMPTGYSYLDYRATITKGGVAQTCFFTISINNSTGVVTGQTARVVGLPNCGVQVNGSIVYYTMSYN